MPDENGVLTYLEVLRRLSEQAERGSVTATVALARELRNQRRESEEVDELISRLMADDS